MKVTAVRVVRRGGQEPHDLADRFGVAGLISIEVCDDRDTWYRVGVKRAIDRVYNTIWPIPATSEEAAKLYDTELYAEGVTEPQADRGTSDAEDAAKWRALMSCERIRVLGLSKQSRLIGVEFWATHPEKTTDMHRELLETYVADLMKGPDEDQA